MNTSGESITIGLDLIVANPRQGKRISHGGRKDDRLDAGTLARLVRIDPELLRPIRNGKAQRDLMNPGTGAVDGNAYGAGESGARDGESHGRAGGGVRHRADDDGADRSTGGASTGSAAAAVADGGGFSLGSPASDHYFRRSTLERMIAKCSAAAALSLCLSLPAAAQSEVDSGRQLYTTHCFVCHGPDGESIPGVNLRSGQFRRASSDDDLSKIILGGIPGTGMPPTNLAEPQRRALVAYIRSMHQGAKEQGSGDAVRGLAVFESKGGCLACHRVGAKGSRLGPDLTGIGSLKTAAYFEQTLTNPNDSIAPQNRLVRVVTKQGVTITGRRLNEDTHTIQLIDEKEHLLSLSKSDLREYALLKTSPMPSYKGKLTQQEISDVVSYLLSLKGSQ